MRRTCVVWLLGVVSSVVVAAVPDDDASAAMAKFESSAGISIAFGKPMRTWDNQATVDGIEFDPPADARCYWRSDTELHCSTDDGESFADATRYRLRVAAGLQTQGGDTLPALELFVETERPKLAATVSRWHAGVPVILIQVRGDEVEASSILASLSVSVDGQALPLASLRLTSLDEGDWWGGPEYRLEMPAIDGQDRHVVVAVKPGLRSRAGPLTGGQDEWLLSMIVNERFTLRDVRCAGRTDPVTASGFDAAVSVECVPGEPVRLGFSDALDAASAKAWEASLPRGVSVLERNVERPRWEEDGWQSRTQAQRSPAYQWLLRLDKPDTTTVIVMPDTLQSASGRRFNGHGRITLRTDAPRAELRSRAANALIADGHRPPVLAEVINTPTLHLDVHALGAEARSERLVVKENARYRPRRVTSAQARKALAEGGWARWTLVDPPSRHARPELHFVAPQFNLVALIAQGEVLVWAMDWDGHAPIADAHVELLRLDNEAAAPVTVASAATDAGGTVVLRLPDAPPVTGAGNRVDRSAQWLVRAVSADGSARASRAVMPLPSWRTNHIASLVTTRVWGVTDRPLYRPGDTVNYRLWIREERGKRLLAPHGVGDLPLALARPWTGKEVLVRIDDTPDAQGNVSGQVRIPTHATDGEYCVGGYSDYTLQGACFYVGTYRAQDLWAELRIDDAVLRPDQPLTVHASAGYYSGGPASGVPFKFTTMLTGLPLGEAYPDYGDYRFIDVMSEAASSGIAMAAAESTQVLADAAGEANPSWPMTFEPEDGGESLELPAFGLMQVSVTASLSEREATISPIASTRYSRFERFVGLRLDRPWLDVESLVNVHAVVIDAEGGLDASAWVEVEVAQQLSGENDVEAVTSCRVRSGQSVSCPFERQRGARYVFTARSGDAAPVEARYRVWGGGWRGGDDRQPAIDLQRQGGPVVAGSAARLVLQQPYDRAWALVWVDGPAGRWHRVQAIDAPATWLDVETVADRSGSVDVKVLVLERDKLTQIRDGLREPPPTLEASLSFDVQSVGRDGPLALAFSKDDARPGSTVRLTVRNNADHPRQVVVAVVDDAVRALAGDWLDQYGPFGPNWLGRGAWPESAVQSFSDWSGRLGIRVVLPRNSVPGRLSGGLPPPPEPMVLHGAADEGRTLDRVEVVGSRIKLVEVFDANDGAARVTGLRPREQSRSVWRAAVRSRFLDAALWQPDLVLQPGESRHLDVVLPDNLTRWRALAWSSDDDDDFALNEATIEVGLPVEVRVQAPLRLFPDDRARIAANVRSALDSSAVADVRFRLESAEGVQDRRRTVTLAAGEQGSTGVEIAPRVSGGVDAVVRARLGDDEDAVGAAIDVAATGLHTRKVQAGWLGGPAVELRLPTLPAGATQPRLRIAVHDGHLGLLRRWLGEMRDYSHRCWEQILSRAVAAAIAIQSGETAAWPEAAQVVAEALENAAFFQNDEGDFRFFADQDADAAFDAYRQPDVALTAYSIEAFAVLAELGHRVEPGIVERAQRFVRDERPSDDNDASLSRWALTLPGRATVDEADLDRLWQQWTMLSSRAQFVVSRLLATRGDARARLAVARLLDRAPLRAGARRFDVDAGETRWMTSSMWAQCALIELLHDMPGLHDDAGLTTQLLAGMTDLYAGGMTALDTQANAQCLRALRGLPAASVRDGEPALNIQVGDRAVALAWPAGSDQAEWEGDASSGSVLRLQRQDDSARPLSFIAEFGYDEDVRRAGESAIGLKIERRYEVLRDGDWHPVASGTVREGDWLRITLSIDAGATRHFVALTDELPGGLQPVDLALAGVAGLDVQRVAGSGSHWFETRRLDPIRPRFYAELLPPGRHQVHYFTRATNAGDYLAPPARAELMYGDASVARTAMARLRIGVSSAHD